MATSKRRWFRRRRTQKLTSPDGLPVTSFPAGFSIALYGMRGSYSAIYRTQPNVRTVVDFLADEVASVKLKVYEKMQTGPLLPSGRLELEEHPMARVLGTPAPRMARSRFWRETIGDLMINDLAFWQKVRDGNGQVRALLRQPPTALTPERDPVTQIIRRYRTSVGSVVPVDDFVIFHGYDPDLHDGNVSAIETLRRILAEEYAAGRNRENTWKNATRKDGVVERPLDAPQWDENQREAWRDDWEGRMSGESNAGRVALLEDGMGWKESAWSPQEMEYLAARKLTRQESAAAFRVDPRLVFAHDDKADKEIRTAFYVDRLVPLLTRLSEEIDAQLLPDFEPFDLGRRVYSEFNIDAKLRGSFEEQAKILVMTTGRGILMPDEARARLNLPPAPDGTGQGLTIPLNVLIGGQASPESPNETPGDMPALGQTPGPGAFPQASIAVSMTEADVRWLQSIIKTNGHVPEPGVDVERLRELAREYAVAVHKHLIRQSTTLRNIAGAVRKTRVPTVDELWMDSERWDRELAADLRDVAERCEVPAVGLEEQAKRINSETRDLLAGALPDMDAVFGEVEERAARLAVSLVERSQS